MGQQCCQVSTHCGTMTPSNTPSHDEHFKRVSATSKRGLTEENTQIGYIMPCYVFSFCNLGYFLSNWRFGICCLLYLIQKFPMPNWIYFPMGVLISQTGDNMSNWEYFLSVVFRELKTDLPRLVYMFLHRIDAGEFSLELDLDAIAIRKDWSPNQRRP